jgi:hypothetical protein
MPKNDMDKSCQSWQFYSQIISKPKLKMRKSNFLFSSTFFIWTSPKAKNSSSSPTAGEYSTTK